MTTSVENTEDERIKHNLIKSHYNPVAFTERGLYMMATILKNMLETIAYNKTTDLIADAKQIVESARQLAYRAVDVVLIHRNWLLGKRIYEENLENNTRKELYGNQTITSLSKELTCAYGGGFDFSSLYKYVRFYQCYPNILDTANPKSFQLSWSHYKTLLYVRMYDELKKGKDDNPTIGIVLCADTDEDIARFSVLKGNEQLFATKYQLYLPTQEQLRKKIERQKEIYQIQHNLS